MKEEYYPLLIGNASIFLSLLALVCPIIWMKFVFLGASLICYLIRLAIPVEIEEEFLRKYITKNDENGNT